MATKCNLVKQGYKRGCCETIMPDGSIKPACQATLKERDGLWYRVITSAHLSRPEHYFSIYMSGCCMHCRKCHSYEFTKNFKGKWMSTQDIAEMCVDYENSITVIEGVERALDWYASELCRCCGACLLYNQRNSKCPGVLSKEQIVLSPQGFGPARNIIGYTGGDLGCCPEFYAQLTEEIKNKSNNLHVLFETNGYGLTPQNLDLLKRSGVDSFWLDIKAFDQQIHKKLCGVDNQHILELPADMVERGFQLEVLSLFIPNWVEHDQICKIAELLVEVDPVIPFTLLAFFPEYKLENCRPPTATEMVQIYLAVKRIGLKKVRMGNESVFVKNDKDEALVQSATGNF